jgi:hypothetical protein
MAEELAKLGMPSRPIPSPACSKFRARLPDFVAGRHVGRAKSQAHSLVLVLRRIGQLHIELVSFSIERFWLNPSW